MARRDTRYKLPILSSLRLNGRLVFILAAALLAASCAEIKQPQPEAFLSMNKPPLKQQIRWSNGDLPKSFDPAKAAAPPETDVVRAVFEGLTALDPKTLDVRPAVAESWTSEDNRVWTFRLRADARWTNGKPVTAQDFVDSWKRIAAAPKDVAHRELLANIKGFGDVAVKAPEKAADASADQKAEPLPANTAPKPVQQPSETKTDTKQNETGKAEAADAAGVEAVSELEFRVTLKRPDPDLPKLVANPVFYPVYGKAA